MKHLKASTKPRSSRRSWRIFTDHSKHHSPRNTLDLVIEMDAPTNKPDNPDEVSSSKVHDHDVPVSMTEEKRDTAEHTRPPPLTEDELALEKKLRRKIDLRIMPLIIWTYLMNYIDRLVVYSRGVFQDHMLTLCRNNYAAARLQGLEADLKLTDTQCKIILNTLNHFPFWQRILLTQTSSLNLGPSILISS